MISKSIDHIHLLIGLFRCNISAVRVQKIDCHAIEMLKYRFQVVMDEFIGRSLRGIVEALFNFSVKSSNKFRFQKYAPQCGCFWSCFHFVRPYERILNLTFVYISAYFRAIRIELCSLFFSVSFDETINLFCLLLFFSLSWMPQFQKEKVISNATCTEQMIWDVWMVVLDCSRLSNCWDRGRKSFVGPNVPEIQVNTLSRVCETLYRPVVGNDRLVKIDAALFTLSKINANNRQRVQPKDESEKERQIGEYLEQSVRR